MFHSCRYLNVEIPESKRRGIFSYSEGVGGGKSYEFTTY